MDDFRYILHKMSRQKWLSTVALLLTACQCILELWLPLLMADIVNLGIFGRSMQQITNLGTKMFVACVLMGISGYSSSLLCAAAGQRFALGLREELYKKIYSLSVEQITDFGPGSLITRLTTDIDICSNFIFSLILLVAEPLILMIGGIIMMWRITSSFGIVFVIFIVIQLLVMILFIRSTTPEFIAMRKMVDKMNSLLQNSFSRFRLIKAFNSGAEEISLFSDTNRNVYEKSYIVQMKLAVFNPIIMLIMNLAIAGVLFISGKQVSIGAVSVGAILSAITYAEQVLLSITAGGQMFRVLAETKPSIARIREVLDTEPSLKDGEQSFTEPFRELRMENISFSYPNGVRVFDSLNFQIHAGEMLAIIGSTGSGKTTISGLCARLFDPQEGKVFLNGKDIRSLKIEDLRNIAALTEKNSAVLEGTVIENIIFGRENISEESIKTAVSAAQLDDYLEKSEGGLSAYLVSMGKSMSSGERQRLTIARALAGNPGLLILDDSTSAIDYETERKMFAAIRNTYPSMAILITTNRLPTALCADKILVLDEGRIIDEGSDYDLRHNCELYRRMCMAADMGDIH